MNYLETQTKIANAIYQTNEAVKYDFDGSGEWN